MRILVRRQAPELTPEFLHKVERRVHLALASYADRVKTIVLCFETAQQCRITTRTRWKTQIRIAEQDDDLLVAVARAADRTARAIARQTRLGYGDTRL